MAGQKEIAESYRGGEKSQCLPLALGSLSSLTVSCNINMSEWRSGTYHVARNSLTIPSFSPSSLYSQTGGPWTPPPWLFHSDKCSAWV